MLTCNVKKNNFVGLNKTLADFEVDDSSKKDWGKSLADKLEQLKS